MSHYEYFDIEAYVDDDEDYDFDDEDEEDEEPREIPLGHADPPGPCTTCGKANQQFCCAHCGEPCCVDPFNVMADTGCGSWIMDWWSNGAMDPDDGNEYWCNHCLDEESRALEAQTAAPVAK